LLLPPSSAFAPALLGRWLASASLTLLGAGCGSTVADLGYYWQAVRGHWQILDQARPIAEVIADPATDAALRKRLEGARGLRRFAADELALPDNGSYTQFARLDRPFAVWNVVAAPEFSLAPYRWCFPVAGCVSYRGYYDLESANREAEQLAASGYDVQVVGVPAYSTLGWFDDPLLSTFIHYPEVELGRLIFHELSHQVVFVKGDTEFNESFATAVEQLGVERWLSRHGTGAQRDTWNAYQRRRAGFLALLHRCRDRLDALYREPATVEARRAAKEAVFETLRGDYRRLRDGDWGGFAGYDRWFERKLGNAHLAAVMAYSGWVPAFRQIYQQEGGDLERFYAAAARIGRFDPAARRAALQRAGEATTIPAAAD
jgi:predicted aminopeptidase